jgi:hypothetical protein
MSKPVQRNLPLCVDDLNQARAALGDKPDHDNSLFLALLFTGFITLQRLGEMTWPDAIKHQTYQKVPLRHTLTITPTSISYTLPHQKNDSLGTGMTILILSDSVTGLDPLPLVRHYLSYRDSKFAYRPALWLTSMGSVPTRTWFLRRLRAHCGRQMSGHSMRAGGATALAIAGMTPDLIQAAGRWSSDEFKKYVRQHAFLLNALFHGSAHAP